MEIDKSEQSLLPAHYILIGLLILAGLFLRWYGLDGRPLHQDEAVSGMHSLYYFANRLQMFYKYDPLLHGPLLYHTIPWSYWFFGVSKWALRFPAALFGSLLMFGPLLFRKRLSPTVVVIATAFLALSPSLIYWSRFIRHDNFVFFSVFGMLLSLYLPNKMVRPIVFFFFFTLHFCAKENAYLHTVLILGFLFYQHFLHKITKSCQKSLISSVYQHFLNHKISWLVALAVSVFLYCWYYSAGFAYSEGILDGVYRKSLLHWFEQDSMEKVGGPFSYVFWVNTFFESWWLPFIFVHVVFFYQSRSWSHRVGFGLFLAVGVVGAVLAAHEIPMEFSSRVLRIKTPVDFIVFFPLLFHALCATTTYVLENKTRLAVCAYAFFTTLVVYSYMGEKNPWLAAYPLITGIVFFAFYIEKNFTHIAIPFVGFFVVLNGIWAYKVNIKEAGEPRHLLSQVQTTREYERRAAWLNKKLEKGKSMRAFPGHQWPLTWYLKNGSEHVFHSMQRPLEEYDYVLGNLNDIRLEKLANTHKKTVLPFRRWWNPDWKNMSPAKAWRYYWFKESWNPPYVKEVLLFEKLPAAGEASGGPEIER